MSSSNDSVYTVQIFKNNHFWPVTDDNYAHAIQILEDKINELKKYDDLCFYVALCADSYPLNLVYWYLNEIPQVKWLAEVLNGHIDSACFFHFHTGYASEQQIRNFNGRFIAELYNCLPNTNFTVQHLDCSYFNTLPFTKPTDLPTKEILKSAFAEDAGSISVVLNRIIKNITVFCNSHTT